MAALSHLPKSTLCSSCIHRIARDDIAQLWYPFHRQLRGKKKSAERPTTINVMLLDDITGFGRKGSICPVEPGRMRNSWYPRHKAEYMTGSKYQGLKPQRIAAERDFTFGMEPKEDPSAKEKAAEEDRPVEVQTKLLPPQRATEILETVLPPTMEFYRAPISVPEPETPIQDRPQRLKRAASSAAAELEAASVPVPKPVQPQLTYIFGSVSTADIAESIKAVLASTPDGARVVIGAEDIKIIHNEVNESEDQDKGIEGDRLKVLGDFQLEVRVKGGEPVVRTVSIKAQEVSQA